MGCVVVYPDGKHQRHRVVKGRLDGKPCRWKLTIWYDVGVLEPDEKNPRRLVIDCRTPKLLREVSADIEAALQDDATNCGGVTNIKWQAIQER